MGFTPSPSPSLDFGFLVCFYRWLSSETFVFYFWLVPFLSWCLGVFAPPKTPQYAPLKNHPPVEKVSDFFDMKGGFSRGDEGEEKRNASFPVPP